MKLRFRTIERVRSHNEIDRYAGPEDRETQDYLRERHGDGYLGFQTFRLVHTSGLFRLSAGEWSDWDENLAPDMRGRLVAGYGGALVPESCAERRIVEMRRIPKYADLIDRPGWILERWMAPSYFDTPTGWRARVVPGTDLPILGPYPAQGEYIQIAGPYSERPSGPFLDRIIEHWELMRDDVLSYAADTYLRKRWAEAEAEDQARQDRWNRESSAANMAAMQPFFSTFLEGGRARQLAAEHAGIESNYGN